MLNRSATVLLIATTLLFSLSLPTRAQDASAAKIAVVDLARVFADMQETKDVQAKLNAERTVLQNTDREKHAKLDDLKSTRDQFKPDSDAYAKAEKDYVAAQIEYETWGRLQTAEGQRAKKLNTKRLYDKIVAATQVVAQRKGYDLVLASQKPIIPDNIDEIDPNALTLAINQRNVLFASPKVDISTDVLNQLDADYKNSTPGK